MKESLYWKKMRNIEGDGDFRLEIPDFQKERTIKLKIGIQISELGQPRLEIKLLYLPHILQKYHKVPPHQKLERR